MAHFQSSKGEGLRSESVNTSPGEIRFFLKMHLEDYLICFISGDLEIKLIKQIFFDACLLILFVEAFIIH